MINLLFISKLVIMLTVAFVTIAERKTMASMQRRLGYIITLVLSLLGFAVIPFRFRFNSLGLKFRYSFISPGKKINYKFKHVTNAHNMYKKFLPYLCKKE